MAYTPYMIPYLVAGVSLLLILAVPFTHRRTRGSGASALLLLLLAFWSFGNAAEVAALTVSGKWLATKIQYLAIHPVGAVWLVFALKYTGRVRQVGLGWIAALSFVPLVAIALAWTDGHQLVKYGFSMEPGSPYMTAKYGPAYYLVAAYQWALLAAGEVALLRGAARRHALFRAQGLLLMLSCLAPLLASVAHVFGFGPLPFLDLTPPMFALGVLIVAVAVYRFGAFDLVPAAREAVIETMPEALLVIDQAGRVIDANPAASRLFAGGLSLVGRDAASLLAQVYAPLLASPPAAALPSVVELGGGGRLLELQVTPLRDGSVVSGSLAVFHDITERETTVRQLQAALTEVRTLSGLIPICAACKKVRDDDGYWQQVEAFVSAHSNAEFTHGLCPQCVASLYPEPSGS